MGRLLLAAVVVAAVVVVAFALNRRMEMSRRSGGPSGGSRPSEPSFAVPHQIDRADFDRPGADWLVVAFTSATCSTCASVVERMGPLASEQVAIQEVEVSAAPELHGRYGVESVPLVIVAGAEGQVRAHAFGPQSAASLWSLVADARAG